MKVAKYVMVVCLMVIVNSVFSQEIPKIRITELEKIITESKTPLVVNFWATWCKPCIEEIPFFQEIIQRFEKDSVQLLLVSLDLKEDYPAEIIQTAAKRKFTAPICWLDETNADYFCPRIDAKWSGGIPASLFVNNKNGKRKFFEQPLTREKLEKEIPAILGN